MILGVQDDVDHGADLCGQDVLRRVQKDAFLQMILEGRIRPLDTRLDHITGHKLKALVQMLGEFRVRPMQVPDEGLQSVQLPEQILGGSASITAFLKISKHMYVIVIDLKEGLSS